MGVNLSYGNQRAHSEQKVVQQTHAGSQLTAGRDLTLQATQGNIDIVGSRLKAGRDTLLDAARDITLHSAANNETVTGSNASHGGSLGVGIGVNSGSAGISVSASVNASKGKENGSTLQHNETTLDSGRQVTLHSGRDTTLTGAQVNGEQIVAEVGRNLTLTSEQDRNRYDSKQQSASAGGSFTFGTMTPSGSLNLSQDKMHSTYDSVQEQTGLFAGKGGFDVKVGEHTQLNGAVIGSTASAENNRLETGTLGFSDIDNHAAYKVEHQSVGISSGGGLDNFIGNLANGLAVAGNKDKSDSSTTHAAVSAGTIIINDTAKQQQNVDDLSRDVEHANQTLSPIFDKEKEQKRMQTLQLIGEIGNQVADIARTQGEIAGLKAKTDPAALQAARAELVSKGNTNPTSEQIAQKAYQSAKATFGTGSAIQQAITASTAAIQGLAGGDITKALAGGAAPYIAEEIHKLTTAPDGEVNKPANLMAHAVVNAALSLAKGENVLAGASSAVTAEAVGMISQAYYGKKPSELTDEQKQKISALASLAAGLAGGLVGGDTASAVSGAQTGKVTVENNALSGKDAEEKRAIELALSQTGQALKPKTPDEVAALEARHGELTKLDAEIDSYVRDACSQGKSSAACQDANALAQGLQQSYEGYVGKLTYKELDREDYAKVSQLIAETSADKWDYVIKNYAASQDISYQDANDRFALAININQAADIAGILYGLKGGEAGKSRISSAAASTLKQLMTKYDEFKQNIASSTKGNNDGLVLAGAGAGHAGNASAELSPNANLSTGAGGKSDTKYTLNKNGEMLGANGVRVDSSTIWKGQGKERIDVENPNPGQRAGQLHYQDNKGNKYYYDPITQTFPDAPKSVNALLKNPSFKKAIEKGMTKYLGEK